MKQVGEKPRIRIIRMRKVPFMDSTGLHNLESLCRLSMQDGIRIVLSGVNESVHKLLIKSGMNDRLGDENICRDINEALGRANLLLEESKLINK
jgi:SulP family sulfate permease